MKNISIEIKVGEKVAIVGKNGAGKTTLAKLIAGLYSPCEGEILVDGINIKKISKESLYKNTTMVFQDFAILGFTIAQNIALTLNNNSIDYNSVRKILNVTEFEYEKFKNNIDTYISKEYVFDGINLSGGEGQKIAIARAYYSDAGACILDEPSAQLDPEAEAKIFEHYLSISKSKTTILITHRLGGVINCDKIIVIDDGRVVEVGKHKELIENKGLYYYLYTLKSNNYNN